MKLKAIICLFLISLLSCFILGSCDKNHDKDKPLISVAESGYTSKYEHHESFEKFELLNNFIVGTPELNGKYFFIINAEEYFYYKGKDLPPYYVFCYDQLTNDGFINYRISSFHDGFVDPSGPNEPQGCTKKTGEWTTGQYCYFAYATDEIITQLTFKHYLIEDSIDIYYRLIRIYQGDKIVGDFIYYATVPDDSYYEQFVKDNLVIIGVNTNET
jgi:hypothetical protein